MLKSKNIPKTVLRSDNSITVIWENIFPVSKDDNIYILEVYHILHDWQTIYWGHKTKYTIQSLSPNTCYNFRIRQKSGDSLSTWIEFKAATETDQIYVAHLSRAIIAGKNPLIRRIIGHRLILLETENKENKTPLMQATERGDLTTTNFLITLGANVNTQDMILKRTALMMAILLNHLTIAQLLIDKGARVDLTDVNKLTAMHYAIDSNNFESVQFAISNGCDINSRDNKGWTSLLRAVVMDSSDDIILYLLENSANITVKDNKGFDFESHVKLTGRFNLLQSPKLLMTSTQNESNT